MPSHTGRTTILVQWFSQLGGSARFSGRKGNSTSTIHAPFVPFPTSSLLLGDDVLCLLHGVWHAVQTCQLSFEWFSYSHSHPTNGDQSICPHSEGTSSPQMYMSYAEIFAPVFPRCSCKRFTRLLHFYGWLARFMQWLWIKNWSQGSTHRLCVEYCQFCCDSCVLRGGDWALRGGPYAMPSNLSQPFLLVIVIVRGNMSLFLSCKAQSLQCSFAQMGIFGSVKMVPNTVDIC